MELFYTTLEAVVSIIGIGIFGFIIIARRILPGNILSVLTPLVIDIALPCMIFSNIILKFDPETYSRWWAMPLWWILFTIIALALTMALSYIAGKETRGEFRVSLFFQNAMFIPLALIIGLYGEASSYIVDLFLFTIFYPSFFFNTYHIFFKKKKDGPKHTVKWDMVFNPVLIVTIIAIIIKVTGMHSYVPDVIVSITSVVGKITIPLIMIIIGGNIYIDIKETRKIYYSEVIKFLFIKNIFFPVIMFGILLLLRPPYPVALLFIIEAAMPPITAASIVTEREGGNRNMVNQLLLFSFIFSVVSVPLFIFLFGRFFQITP